MSIDDTAVGLAVNSPLSRYPWPHRGVAPGGYTKGMALAFCHAYRDLKQDDRFMVAATIACQDDPEHDVLDWYAGECAAAGAATDTRERRLIALFAIMMGLGMQESSGRHCAGPDIPEDRGPKGHPVATTPQNAEAGLFQVSYDSVGCDPDRLDLIATYRNRNDLQDVFAEGSGCGNQGEWPATIGMGVAADFQQQTKACPLFAALYSALLLRRLRREWGTLEARSVEVRRDAVELFGSIAEVIDAS